MFDTPPRKVLIRGKIIEITEENAMNFGIYLFDVLKSINVFAEGIYLKDQDFNYSVKGIAKLSLQLEQIESKTGKDYVKEFSIIVMNNNPGKIPIGDDKYVVLIPHIGYKDYINFKIEIQQKFKVDIYLYLENITNYKTFNEFETNVSLYNNETLIISGVKTIGKEKIQRGIPIIENIPLLGYLFKMEETIDKEKTLIIIISPEIMPLGK